MTADHEKFVTIVFQALGEWWASLGALAWPLVGVALVGGILTLTFVLRWVLRGGLSRHVALECSNSRAVEVQSVSTEG